MDQAVSDAARIAAGDDRVRYDSPAMSLHWITAALVVTLWLLAQAWGFLKSGSPPRHALQAVHISLGLVLILVLAMRIFWRLGPGRRVPPAGTGLIEQGARAVHVVVYVLLIGVVPAGLVNIWAQHDKLTFFWLFSIAMPHRPDHAVAKTVDAVHWWIATTILILAGVHALAALFHHYVLRDDVLLRMLPGPRARRAEAAAPPPPGAPPGR